MAFDGLGRRSLPFVVIQLGAWAAHVFTAPGDATCLGEALRDQVDHARPVDPGRPVGHVECPDVDIPAGGKTRLRDAWTRCPHDSHRPSKDSRIGSARRFGRVRSLRFTGCCPVVSTRVATMARRSDSLVGNLAVDGHRLALKCPGRGGGVPRHAEQLAIGGGEYLEVVATGVEDYYLGAVRTVSDQPPVSRPPTSATMRLGVATGPPPPGRPPRT